METFVERKKQRLTQRQKNRNDNQWYRAQADLLDNQSTSDFYFEGMSGFRSKKVNYDLFNNIINKADFEYVCKPFGATAGELPANMQNRDIVSGKIKVLLGMEMKMPFSWKVVAVNEEATTRKEQKEFGMIKDYVTSEIMKPIKQQVAKAAQEQTKGQKLTAEQVAEIEQQVEQETQSKTPDEVRKYMRREHQDPAEAQAHQLLEYLILAKRVRDKFNKGWKHMNLGGKEVYHVGIFNNEPDLTVVNSLFFKHDMSPDLDYIEDGEWATCEYRMTPSEVVAKFGSQLSNDDIDDIYEFGNNPNNIADADFTFAPDRWDEAFTVRVLHTTWKSLMKIGFLTYLDKAGQEQLMIVGEDYKFKEDEGDIELQWEWIPETHECWKIMSDKYVYCRPVPGQNKDLDNLYSCKLPYYGAACDNLNSPITAPMDRMKYFQYLYNIIIYRIELLMASDKGKMLAANINAIPKSAGIDIEKWSYFLEANKIAWFNPNEEGNKHQGGDIVNMVKEIDMSLVSNIDQYIKIAEYIESKCGSSIGVTPQMEAQIAPGEAVGNTQQNLVQASHIIQPYFELHNNVKGNVLTALLETAKVAYAGAKQKKLSYILDDMSMMMLTLDGELLDSSSYGIFVANSSKANEAKQAIINLSQAAMQNQQADILDVVKIIRSESIQEAEEMLMVSRDRLQAQQSSIEEMRAKEAQAQRKHEEELAVTNFNNELTLVREKAKEDRKTKVQVQAIQSMGFDPNKDQDDDGTPDVLEVAEFGVNADIKRRQQDLAEREFEHQIEEDAHSREQDGIKNKLDKEKIQVQKMKKSTT